MPWEDPTLSTDEDGIIGGILDAMADKLDGWEPVEGAPEVALAEEIGREIAATNALAIESLQVALAGMGETVFGFAVSTGSPAQITARLRLELRTPAFLAPDTVSRQVVIPAGFTVVGEDIAYQLIEPYDQTVIFARVSGSSSPDATEAQYFVLLEVPMTATENGTAGNLAADTPLTVVTATQYVVSGIVSENGEGIGGTDEESLLEYLDRLAAYLSTLRPGGVRADDLAAFARTSPGVYRAIGFDLYDPADPGVEHDRTATIVAITANGEPLGGLHKALLANAILNVREVNFNVILADPTYSPINIETTIDTAPDADPETVQAAVREALVALIDPATWGSTAADPTAWTEKTALRYLDVAAVIGQVPGVASIISVTFTGYSGTRIIDGPAALPSPVDAFENPSSVTVTLL